MAKKINFLFLGLTALSLTVAACSPSTPTSSSDPSESGGGSTGEVPSSEPASSDPASSNPASSEPISSEPISSDPVEELVYNGNLRIWYHLDSMDYSNTCIYLWNSQVRGVEYEWTGTDDSYGAYFEINLGESDQFKDYPSSDIRMIIKAPGTWSGQSDDTIIPFAGKEQVTEDGVTWLNIYTGKGEGRSITVFADKSSALGDSIERAYIDSDWKTIHIEGTGMAGEREESEVGKIADYSIYKFTSSYYALDAASRVDKKEDYLFYADTGVNSNSVTLALEEEIELGCSYTVEAVMAEDTSKVKTKTIGVTSLYDTSKFINEYTTDLELGVTEVSGGGRRFRVWAPTSGSATVRFYQYGDPSSLHDGMAIYNTHVDVPMTYVGRGVYALTVYPEDECYSYSYYNYVVNNANGEVEAVDPYARATGINGLRGAILDFSADATTPEGWNEGKGVDEALSPITSANQLTVYEAHIRDLTADETWVSNKNNKRGGYNAFAEEGTTYNGVTTGFDHIKELGVNAIQLLPVFDQDNDERLGYLYQNQFQDDSLLTEISYNWGYNPQNYNVVEGAYSSNPADPNSRVKEYRNLIQVAANNDIRIIMDVVYNHMSSVSNNSFTKLMPQYFFRTDSSGNYTDGSGVGNETATERIMMRRFVVDSVSWWAETYRVKGFRFDLMGCIDIDTMKAVREALNEIDPTIVIYGEGWTGGGSALSGNDQSSTGNVYRYLNTNDAFPVGAFNDAGRDGTKGNTTYSDVTPNSGFMNLTDPGTDVLYNSLTQILGENRWQSSAGCNPNQTVNYVACHDNYTLYDQLNYQLHIGTPADVIKNNEDAMIAATAAQSISLFGQGIGFINGGDEIFRQKLITSESPLFQIMVDSYKHQTNGTNSWIEGDGVELTEDTWLVRNSYQYGDQVNSYKWDRKVELKDYYQKWVELVALRNSQMGNYLGQTHAEVNEGKTYCFDYTNFENNSNIMGGGFSGKDGTNAYIFMANGLGGAESGQIGCGSGTLEVLYSSSGRHAAGETITVTSDVIDVGRYECLIVKRAS